MEINIQGIQCAGVSFTEGLDDKYIKYFEIIDKYKNEQLNYRELQVIIEEEQQISNSAVRVDFPFLFNGGFIKDYKKEKIKLSDFFSNEGLSYYEVIKIKKALDENEDEYLYNKFKELRSLLIISSLKYRKENKQEEYYLKMLDFIYKYGEITEKEFYLMIHCEGNNEMLHRYVTDYRTGNIDIDLVGVNNTYQYTKKLLLQADIIFERNDEKKLILNEKHLRLIENLIN